MTGIDPEIMFASVKGHRQGFDNAINEVLRIVDRLNHNGSVSVKLLRKELETMKGGEK